MVVMPISARWCILFLATAILIWWYYWKIQLVFNSSALSFYTPDSFPVENESEVDRLVRLGGAVAKTKRVVIATMLRDVVERLPVIMKKAERVGGLFADYRILVVENDSTDGTREALLRWAAANPKVVVLGCGYNAKECKLPKTPKTEGHNVNRPRIQKMVDLRNIYLDEIARSYSDFDYVAMWDLDSISTVYLDGIQHTLGYMAENADVTVACAYGIYRWGALTLFYDTYALLHPGEKFHISQKTLHDIKKGWWEAKYTRGDEPYDVDSCFSGFAIYDVKALVGGGEGVRPRYDSNTSTSGDPLGRPRYDSSASASTSALGVRPRPRYDMSPDDNLECEHVRLNKKIHGRKVVNPSMINLVLLND